MTPNATSAGQGLSFQRAGSRRERSSWRDAPGMMARMAIRMPAIAPPAM